MKDEIIEMIAKVAERKGRLDLPIPELLENDIKEIESEIIQLA